MKLTLFLLLSFVSMFLCRTGSNASVVLVSLDPTVRNKMPATPVLVRTMGSALIYLKATMEPLSSAYALMVIS